MNLLFVCLGNICRSPTAHGVFAQMAQSVGHGIVQRVDSAGTAAYHAGEPPDPRTQAAALARGYDLRALRARQVRPADFAEFDLVLAMDRANLLRLREIAAAHDVGRARLGLFLEFAGHPTRSEVPDPYHGGPQGFEDVLDLVEDASKRLLVRLARGDQ